MSSGSIHIIYHPTYRGYSGYSKELDGLHTEARTIQELFSKIRHKIRVRINALLEIGREKEAKDLEAREIIFLED